ncbi:DNA-3-methyladenine glycosylase [Vagococcus martis]|uniref:DNA-3-methyladenine glycosylase n=1 Tax=Vagococcus martis TaxID=1768210 RepID=A0A1V4DHE6_9ENTE|nr:DNA-3-methyladenine glycosylase I [Vagococcus martis]OPF87908.1 DNA-3-methyladenine glycosylase [Vagococcus martis]
MVIIKRCEWANSNDLEKQYHDNEWGTPNYDDATLFESLILESMQAGLSWSTMLKKRDTLRKAYDGFDVDKISQYTTDKVELLMNDEGVIRHRLKIQATISNAQSFKLIQNEYGSFSDYIWSFVDFKPIKTHWETIKSVPSSTELSDKISKDLKSRGFKFLGTTTVYAFMQSVGLVDDHVVDCFRRTGITN